MRSILIILLLFAVMRAEARADLSLPVDGTITSGMGWRLDPFGSGKLAFHRGIDIATPTGTPVRATRRGRVAHAGSRGGYGIAVIIEHDGGDRTLYGHNSSLAVKQGEQVEAGAIIAYSGNSGRSTGPHVHYELLPGGRPVNNGLPAMAEAPKARQTTGMSLRHTEEQRLDETVDSILRRISDVGGLTARVGQGG